MFPHFTMAFVVLALNENSSSDSLSSKGLVPNEQASQKPPLLHLHVPREYPDVPSELIPRKV